MNRALYLAMEDDDTAALLLRLTKRHLSLVKEHGKANTLPERREVIKEEIESLRRQRDGIIKCYELKLLHKEMLESNRQLDEAIQMLYKPY